MKYLLGKCNITIHQQCYSLWCWRIWQKSVSRSYPSVPLWNSHRGQQPYQHCGNHRPNSEVKCKVSFTSFFQTSWAYSPFNTCIEHFHWGWASKINKHPPFLSSWCSRRSNAPWDQRPCLPCFLLCLKASQVLAHPGYLVSIGWTEKLIKSEALYRCIGKTGERQENFLCMVEKWKDWLHKRNCF